MAESVRRDNFFDACFFHQVFDDQKDHHSRQPLATPVQKKDVFFACLYYLVITYCVAVVYYLIHWASSYLHKYFFVFFLY